MNFRHSINAGHIFNICAAASANQFTKIITAVTIAPGFVSTEMAQEFIERYRKEAAVSDIPLGEMIAPSEVADLIAFEFQPDQHSLNDATLDINGGSYVR